MLVTKTLEGEKYDESLKRISDFVVFEKAKLRREAAVNNLESHVIEAQMRLDQKEYASCATKKELEDIKAMCSTISEWLYEDGIDAAVEIFEEKLETLKKKTDEVYAKHWEHNERPEAIKALHGLINGTEGFLASVKNITQDPEKKDVFTEKEVEDLEKAISDTKDWRDKEVAAQKKLARNDPIKLTVKQLTDKMGYLDREVKYLVKKIKAWRPKEKPKPKKKKSNETEPEVTEPTDETQQEVPTDKTADDEPKVEEIPLEDAATEEAEPEIEATEDDEHSEL